ncbi:MAG: replication-relaxation family protein [Chloroflexi bacterium]|nr:replication-relaxation family protein [Chloroflexota bacterium]
MRTGDPGDKVLAWLNRAPLLDRLELAALSGWSRSAVYRAVAGLERERLVEAVAHASELTAPTKRFTLSAAGLKRLAEAEGVEPARLLRERPLSEQARRLWLGRIDALASLYRLCCCVADCSYPLQLRSYRALPVDLCLRLADGRTVALARLGRLNERSSVTKRLARLRDGLAFAALLVLTPDETRLRYAARRLRTMPGPCFLALERDAAGAGADARIWRTPSGSVALSLREALNLAGSHQSWPVERPLVRVSEPIGAGASGGRTDWTLSASLGPSEKRALDLLADWPWLRLDHLAALLDVRRARQGELLHHAAELGLLIRPILAGRTRLALSDRGLALLARRDRAAFGELRKRWSAELAVKDGGRHWRNLRGSRTRQLLRNLDHTEAVHSFVAALAEQARSKGWELVQLHPPQRASRYFRLNGRLHSIQPDAFGVIRCESREQPFFLEWERRAIRPSTMARRLAPYLRYYSTRRPVEDHGLPPIVLVAFEDELAADHFGRVAREEMLRAGVDLPLYVTHRGPLSQHGPLAAAWRVIGDVRLGAAFI